MRASKLASPMLRGRSTIMARVRTWLYASVVIAYLVIRVGQLPALAPLLSGLSLLAILVSLPALGWMARLLTGLFVGGGAWMLHAKGASWLQFLSAFGEMAYLLALFVVLPVLSVPVKLGGYAQAIQAVLSRRVASVFRLNCLVTSLSFLCGSFMSLAAVPIMMTSM